MIFIKKDNNRGHYTWHIAVGEEGIVVFIASDFKNQLACARQIAASHIELRRRVEGKEKWLLNTNHSRKRARAHANDRYLELIATQGANWDG